MATKIQMTEQEIAYHLIYVPALYGYGKAKLESRGERLAVSFYLDDTMKKVMLKNRLDNELHSLGFNDYIIESGVGYVRIYLDTIK